jgi:hypothetical protein
MVAPRPHNLHSGLGYTASRCCVQVKVLLRRRRVTAGAQEFVDLLLGALWRDGPSALRNEGAARRRKLHCLAQLGRVGGQRVHAACAPLGVSPRARGLSPPGDLWIDWTIEEVTRYSKLQGSIKLFYS